MSYSKQELLENLIEFKNEHNRYPTRKDFKAKRITPSKNTFYRVFDSMQNAIKQAELYEKGDLTIKDEREIKSVKPISKKGGFQCPFCGNYASGAEGYYSSLATILAKRFTNLLKSNNGQSYFDGVIDCILAVFGGDNRVMRRALALERLLEKFEQRYGSSEEETGHKLKCYLCGQWKEDWEVTIDESKVTGFICEECLSSRKNRKNKRKEKT